jgi:hypothetical protein
MEGVVLISKAETPKYPTSQCPNHTAIACFLCIHTSPEPLTCWNFHGPTLPKKANKRAGAVGGCGHIYANHVPIFGLTRAETESILKCCFARKCLLTSFKIRLRTFATFTRHSMCTHIYILWHALVLEEQISSIAKATAITI